MAINQARNDGQLKKMLAIPLQEAVKYVMEDIWAENKTFIMETVYFAGTPEVYERTYDTNPEASFENAWDFNVWNIAYNKIEGKFFYAPNNMSVGNEINGQHASVVDGSDSRQYLAEIIYEGLAGRIFGDGFWTQERNAFEALEKWLGKENLKKSFEKGMDKAGLQYKRHNAPIQARKD